MNFAVAVGAVTLWPLNECFIYFTDLTMWLTLFSSILLFTCARDTSIKQKTGWLALSHALFQTCAICNTIVVVIYWSLLHQHTLIKNKNYPGRTIHTYFSHSFPALSMVLLWWVNEIRLYANHWKGLVLLAGLYCLWNYYCFRTTGVVLYPFMDWNNIWAPINCVVIALTFTLVYKFLAKASYWIKPISKHSKLK